MDDKKGKLTMRSIQRKHQIGFGVVLAIIAVTAIYWADVTFYPTTDDAYIGANQIGIMSQIPGAVSQIFVTNNQEVKKGQILFSINSDPFKLTAGNAEFELQAARKQLRSIEIELNSAMYDLQASQAIEVEKEKYFNRANTMYLAHYLSVSDMDKALMERDIAIANTKRDKSLMQKLQNELQADTEQVKSKNNQLQIANINLQHTIIYAPHDGIITNFDLRPGQVVSAADQLFTLIERGHIWVDANFEETQLQRIRVGQPVKIQVDMFGSKKFDGVVASISPASGAFLSLLPTENFSGNWVKITQRISVRIKFLKPVIGLPVGASAKVTVNTLEI